MKIMDKEVDMLEQIRKAVSLFEKYGLSGENQRLIRIRKIQRDTEVVDLLGKRFKEGAEYIYQNIYSWICEDSIWGIGKKSIWSDEINNLVDKKKGKLPQLKYQILKIAIDENLSIEKSWKWILKLIFENDENIELLTSWDFDKIQRFKFLDSNRTKKRDQKEIDEIKKDHISKWVHFDKNEILKSIILSFITRAPELKDFPGNIYPIILYPTYPYYVWDMPGLIPDVDIESMIKDEKEESKVIKNLKKINELLPKYCRIGELQTELWNEFELRYYSKQFKRAPKDVLSITKTFTGYKPGLNDILDSNVDENRKVRKYFWYSQSRNTKSGQSIKKVITQLDLLEDEFVEENVTIDMFLRRHFGALGLKVNYGIIFQCSEFSNLGIFPYNEQDFLDLLGYERSVFNGKYHHSNNRRKVQSILAAFSQKVIYKIEIGTEDDKLEINSPLITIDENSSYKRLRKDKVIWSGCEIRYNPKIWEQVQRKKNPKYFLFDKNYLRLDADSRKLSIYIYPFISWLWYIGGSEVTRTLKYIADETGLIHKFMDIRQRAREIKNLYNEFDKLCVDGLIGDWRKKEDLNDLYNINKIKITFKIPDEHGYKILAPKWRKKFGDELLQL